MGKKLYEAPWDPQSLQEAKKMVDTRESKAKNLVGRGNSIVAICPHPDKMKSIRTTEELRNIIFSLDDQNCAGCLKCKCLLMDMKPESMKVGINVPEMNDSDSVICNGCAIKEACFLKLIVQKSYPVQGNDGTEFPVNDTDGMSGDM